MSNFFVPDKVYKKRIAICKKCEFYFKPTGNCKMCGCFMKIKARISMMDCPKQFWTCWDFDNKKSDAKTKIPKALINELNELYPDFKNGRAKDIETKKRMITLYNVLFNGHFALNSNCPSCLQSVFDGLTKVFNENKTDEI
tara:strand:+ start:489 stop:911 length:423 start_codon:yes stop_codon:yes gene_type:complete